MCLLSQPQAGHHVETATEIHGAELLLEGPRSQLPAGSSFQEPIHQEPLNCSQIFNMALWKNLTLHIFVQNVPLH